MDDYSRVMLPVQNHNSCRLIKHDTIGHDARYAVHRRRIVGFYHFPRGVWYYAVVCGFKCDSLQACMPFIIQQRLN
jgi:hypothetical protein